MERYDYKQAVKDDVIEYIKDNYTEEEISERLTDPQGWAEDLNEALWTADSVTGNASGSYYCNAWKAEEAICHNLDLLGEALQEFGSGADYLERGAEACDVTIRCYLLYSAIEEALEDLAEEYPPIDPEKLTPEEAIKKSSCFDTFCGIYGGCRECPLWDSGDTAEECEKEYNRIKEGAQ